MYVKSNNLCKIVLIKIDADLANLLVIGAQGVRVWYIQISTFEGECR